VVERQMGVLAFLLRAEWLAIFLAGVVVYLDFGGQPLLLPFRDTHLGHIGRG